MKVNCSFGVLPLVYPINTEFAHISWFCLQKGNPIIHLVKMGLVLRVFWNQPGCFWNMCTTVFTCCLLSWNEICSVGDFLPRSVISINLEMALEQVQEWHIESFHSYYEFSNS